MQEQKVFDADGIAGRRQVTNCENKMPVQSGIAMPSRVCLLRSCSLSTLVQRRTVDGVTLLAASDSAREICCGRGP